MKIDDRIINYEINKQLPNSNPNEVERTDDKKVIAEKNSIGSGQSKENAIVNLSQNSKEVQKIKEVVQSSPDLREEKVAELKDRIESGTYNIDNDGVAEKLVNAFLEEIEIF